MRFRRIFSLLTAIWLQFAPLLSRLEPVAASVAQPIVMLLRWLASATVVSGAFHAVSAATGIITANPVSGTTGVPFAYRIAVNSKEYGNGKAYTAKNIPPGLKLSLSGNFTGSPTASGTFTLSVTGWQNSNASGFNATLPLVFTIVGKPPTIVTPPQNLTVNPGTQAEFTVVATGEAPLTYRWIKEDIELATITTNLTFANATAANAGRYRVRVTSPGGITLSDFATLTVVSLPPPPVISAQPTNQTVNAGATASFAVEATGQSPLTFAWLKDNVELGGNATNKSLTLSNTVPANAGAYRARVSNPGGNVLSDIAKLTVISLPPPPVITAQPTNQTVNAGATASFAVETTGQGPLTFAWLKDNVELGGNATNKSLTLSNTIPANAGAYRARVSNPGGNVLSDIATLTINTGLPSPKIVSQTTNITLYPGESAHLNIVLDATTTLQLHEVRWQRDGIFLTNQTNLRVDLTNVSANPTGQYLAIVNGPGGTTASAPIIVTVVEPLTLISPSRQVDHLHLAYKSIPGREYNLEGTTFDATQSWQLLQTLKPLTDTDETLELFGEIPYRFFRLRVVPLP